MEKIVRFIDRITNAFGLLSGVFMILGTLLILAEIVVRGAFNSTLYITHEYIGYFMAAITFFGLAYTLKEKGHIRLTFLHRVVKVGKPRVLLDIYTYIAGLVIFSIITYAVTDFFLGTVEKGTQSIQISKTYLAIPQSTMVIGCLLITLQFLAEIIRSIIKLRTGDVYDDDAESGALGR